MCCESLHVDNARQATIPRAAALIDVGALTDVSAINAEDTFTRAIYAGNAIATIKSSDKTKVCVCKCLFVVVFDADKVRSCSRFAPRRSRRLTQHRVRSGWCCIDVSGD